MQLGTYLKKNNITVVKFAAEAGLSTDAIYKYLRGERRPRDPEKIERIKEASNGKVTISSFYELPTKGSS